MQCACAILPSVVCLAVPYFSTLSRKRNDFLGGEGGECVFIFSTIFVGNISYSKKNSARYYQSLSNVIFFRQILEKYSNIKFHENPSIGSRVVPYGLTDRRTDMRKLIAAF